MKKQTMFNVFRCRNSYTPSATNTEKYIFQHGETSESRPPERIVSIDDTTGTMETTDQSSPEDAEVIKQRTEAEKAQEAAALRLKEIEKAERRDERIKAWFELGPRLTRAINGLHIGDADKAMLHTLYRTLQGGHANISSQDAGRWQRAKDSGNFDSDRKFSDASTQLFAQLKQSERTQAVRIDWQTLCGNNTILLAAAEKQKSPAEHEEAAREQQIAARITAWFDLGAQLLSSKQMYESVADVYYRIKGFRTNLPATGTTIAKNTGNFDSDKKFTDAVLQLQLACAPHSIDLKRLCAGSPVLLAALGAVEEPTQRLATAIAPGIRGIDATTGKIEYAEATEPAPTATRDTAPAEALLSVPPPEPPPTEPAPAEPVESAAPATEAASAAESVAPAEIKTGRAAEKTGVRPEERTAEQKIAIMARAAPAGLDAVKSALGIAAETDPEKIVKAVHDVQVALWEKLPAQTRNNERFGKYDINRPFWDGVWGPDTQEALKIVAGQKDADQKWKDMLAALNPPAAAEQRVTAAPEQAPEIKIVTVPRTTKRPLVTRPTEIHYPLGGHRAPGEVDPKQAEAGDILKIAYGHGIKKYDDRPVNLPAGTLLKVVRVKKESDEVNADATSLEVRTADGREFKLPVDVFATASRDDASRFGQTEYAAATEKYDADFAADRLALTGHPAGFQPTDTRFVVLKQQTNIVGQGQHTGRDVSLDAASQGDVIAILGATDDQYLVRAQDGRVGFIYKNTVNPAAIIERSGAETIEVAVGKAKKQHETLVAALVPPRPTAAVPPPAPPEVAPPPVVVAEGADEEPPEGKQKAA